MDKQEQLVRATYAGNVERVKALLNEGVNPNSADRIEQTALFFAARSGHTEIVKALLTAGAEVDKKAGHKKRTALFMAAIKEKEIFIRLCRQGISAARSSCGIQKRMNLNL